MRAALSILPIVRVRETVLGLSGWQKYVGKKVKFVEKKEFQTKNVMLLSFAHFVHDIYTSFLSPLLPLIIENLSISLGQAGLLSTINQLPSLFNPLIGFLADKRGLARWLVILAPSLTAIPMGLIGSVSSYGGLLVLLFLAGISVALFHVPAPVLISQVSGVKKGRGMSFYMTGGEIARTLGPLMAVAAVSLVGLDRLYLTISLAIATSTLLYFRLEPLELQPPKARSNSFMAPLKEIRPVLAPLSGILTARAFMHSALMVFLPVFVERETGNLWLAGMALACYEALGVAGVLSAGILSDRLGRRRILSLSVASAPVFLLLFVITSGPVRFTMLLLTGFTLLASSPVMLAMIQENAEASPSAANGLYMMVSFLVRSVAIILVGVMGDFFGLPNMYLISACIGFCGIPFLFKLKQ